MDRMLTKKRWTLRRLLTLGGVAACVAFVAYRVIASVGVHTLRVERQTVLIEQVTEGEFLEYIPVVGTVEPIRTHFLDAVEGGRVDTIYCEAGAQVHEGDKLLKLANTSLLLDIMYREAELVQQRNNLQNTRLAMEQNRLATKGQLLELAYLVGRQRRLFDRCTELVERNLVSREEYEDTRDQYDYLQKKHELTFETFRQDSLYRAIQLNQLQQSLALMESNLAVIRQNYESLVVRAPVSGQLTALNAQVGESKSRGERLGQIDIMEGFKVRAAVDEFYVARVQVGQRCESTYGDSVFTLAVDKVYPEVRNGRFAIDMVFAGAAPAGIRRGQTLHIRLALGSPDRAILVPRGAFAQDTGGQWVFAVDESERLAVRRSVKLGLKNPDYFQVVEGLRPGDHVITSSYAAFGEAERLQLH